MIPLNQKDLDKKFKKQDVFNLFNENHLGFLISKGKLAEFYCKILFECKWPKKKNLHYDLIKNNLKYEVKNRKRKKTDKNYSDICEYLKGNKTPGNFPVPLDEFGYPYFNYLLYVFLSSNNKPIAIMQYNSKYLDFKENKMKRRNKKMRVIFPENKFKIKYCIDKIYKIL